MIKLAKALLTSLLIFFCLISRADASLDNDNYEGNIFTIVTGNGALVPPPTTLSESFNSKRTSVLVFYLDDSATSKSFAPVVSGIKLLWPTEIDLLPLTIDELQNKNTNDPKDPATYWHGKIPEVVVINPEGKVIFDEEGQVSIDKINKAISKSTGIKPKEFTVSIKSFNEYNSEAAKDGYADPR
tara:strand:+ start:159 stop:713 length:555 start_codon:yes stop_codon:yes gene_type:complete